MKELFQLPEKFEIHKKGFSKEIFLNKARLTGRDKKLITDLVESIQLAYDVRFHDGSEIILMDVALCYRLNRSTDIEVARAISTALPYDCITLIKYKEYARIVVFSKQSGSADTCRSVVRKQASTQVFDINRPRCGEWAVIDWLHGHLCDKQNTAKKIIDTCVTIIGENKNEPDWYWDYRKEEDKTNREILTEIQNGMDEDYDPESEGIMDNIYDYDDETLVVALTEEAFCSCAYTLYLEVQGRINESDWLLQYAKCCVKALSEIYKGYEVKPVFYRRLGAEFRAKRVTDQEDYLEDRALGLLREMLYEEYTWLFDAEEYEEEYEEECSIFP